MNIQRAFSIKGVGKYLPKTTISSSKIEEELGLSKGYIFKNIGVKTRHVAMEESNTFMAEQALRSALKDANMSIKDIDCLIGASATFDYIIPNRSCLIKNAFKEAFDLDFPCIDIDTVCTSFISALDYATLLLHSGDYRNIAIVSSEISSIGLNPNDAETYSLFGDGAAAVIISTTNQKNGLIQYKSKTYAEGAKYTIIEAGGNMNPTKNVPYDPALYSFQMQGRKLLKKVKSTLPIFLSQFFKPLPVSLQDINLIIPHQASKLGLRMLATLNKGNSENIVDQLENHGNCIAASIPIALVTSIENKTLTEGDTCFLLGTAAGITISGLLFKYSRL
ncbi:3-oxoacyl-[acyl-carrier-protein] synthase III C-terminal domain-containing protein [Marivirga sp.]|uniref:3-oxoacyl-[acyl-carrier-protein] synthase III C-terminal domain-containing protein n=1 Tax=Marivirga sp. TaxID=2018662 RepID=UPI0025FF9A5A|nr:3-oxoacyl-[acyl-carrier-protein] synthase III C-terminal domain-containing protein [Marivirga sp.]